MTTNVTPEPKLPKLPKHPATYTASIVECIDAVLHEELDAFPPTPIHILDPMAGTGKLFDLCTLPHVAWYGVDLERWQDQDGRVDIGDATALHHPDKFFDAVVCSPTYGNGMADHHVAKDASTRTSYFHRMAAAGVEMDARNTGWLHFGPRGGKRETARYKIMHMKAWREVWRVLKPGGVFVLNVKNFYSAGGVQDVSAWHADVCGKIGFVIDASHDVPVPGLKFGDPKTMARAETERVWVMRRPK